ncbi:hypothetical protein HHL22_11850 [Hymenobacter sp. RP-2-7]|uniref:Uncharacterized protein n=1 Tax=Hymenobacter polaris TaxID=2682546 RepID=A0A7Y0AEI3_9BACT|nr:hypothetical protein [Hymenobacter polaris]NML65899.1 hypothetical protein [Hymenobacter polaris]
MNYVKHSVAAHERLRARPDARPHHVSLYWALFFAWNAARFPDELPLHRDELMAAAHIGNKDTLTATLRALETFGLLTYQPSRSVGGSRVLMASLDGPVTPAVGQPAPAGTPNSEATQPAPVAPAAGQPVPPTVGQPTPEVPPGVGQHSLVDKTADSVNSDVNSDPAASPKKNAGQVFTGEGQSEAQVLDDLTGDPSGAGAAPKKKVAPKMKGVGKRPPSPREPRPRRPAPLQELPFRESPLFALAAFTAAFAGTDYALADLPHYHQLIDNWRDKKTGLPPVRRDWAATARRFMLNDAHDNRLKLAPGTHRPPTEPGPGSQPPLSGGIPVTGYRSSRWD